MAQMVIVSYFALTTLSTVGYGDYYPISTNELIIAIFFMLGGIGFFSYIMNSFQEIIKNYDQRMGNDNEGSDLNNWIMRLTRFTDKNKPLQTQLINQIDRHFSFFWSSDRLRHIQKDNEFLNQCPLVIQKHIIINYLFDDVISRYKYFFNTEENKDSLFLYDVCFGLKPIKFKFDDKEDDVLILDEENEVSDFYFIQTGRVGIGYYLMT